MDAAASDTFAHSFHFIRINRVHSTAGERYGSGSYNAGYDTGGYGSGRGYDTYDSPPRQTRSRTDDSSLAVRWRFLGAVHYRGPLRAALGAGIGLLVLVGFSAGLRASVY